MKSGFLALLVGLFIVPSQSVTAQDRLPPIPAAAMTEAQKRAVAEYVAARPAGPFGPWWVYLRIPEIMTPLRQLHEHVHAQTRLGNRLTHLVIFTAAREWTQQHRVEYALRGRHQGRAQAGDHRRDREREAAGAHG